MNQPRIPSHRFEEHSLHYAGTRTRQSTPNSNVTNAREEAMGEIYAIAKQNNIPLDYVITKILANSTGELQTYVQSKGETPLTDPTALALQAVLLRAQDVGTVADTLDTTDEDALKVLENNLQEDIDSNAPGVDTALSIPAQSAIACALQFLSDQATSNGQPSTMSGVTKTIQAGASKWRKAKATSSANNDDGSGTDDNADLGALIDSGLSTSSNDPNDDAAVAGTATPVSVSSQLAVIPGGAVGSPSVAATIPSIAVNASTLPQAGTSNTTTTGGVLNAISSALSQVSNIATQATTTATTLNKAISGAGASSIATYVQNNSGTITMIIIVIVLVIVFSNVAKGK